MSGSKQYQKRPELRGLNTKDYKREWARLFRAERAASGMTCRGSLRKPRKHAETRGMTRDEQRAFYKQLRQAHLSAMGLTRRGTPRKYYRWPELAGMTGPARQAARIYIWEQRRMAQESRCKVAVALRGATLAAQLRRAA